MTWNPITTRPAKPDVYELQSTNLQLIYAYWTGKHWGASYMAPTNVPQSSAQGQGVDAYNCTVWREMKYSSYGVVPASAPIPAAPPVPPVAQQAWQNIKVQPGRAGVYELEHSRNKMLFYSFWNGSYWGVTRPTMNRVSTKMTATKSTDCYDGTIANWREIPGQIYTPVGSNSAMAVPPPSPVKVSNSNRVTYWHLMDNNPSVPGVYCIDHVTMPVCFAPWNGQFWGVVQDSYADAYATMYLLQGPFMARGQDCYNSHVVNGWTECSPEDMGFASGGIIHSTSAKSKTPKEFAPDEVKPELMSKRIRDWL
jgi:hypothetical protein